MARRHITFDEWWQEHGPRILARWNGVYGLIGGPGAMLNEEHELMLMTFAAWGWTAGIEQACQRMEATWSGPQDLIRTPFTRDARRLKCLFGDYYEYVSGGVREPD